MRAHRSRTRVLVPLAAAAVIALTTGLLPAAAATDTTGPSLEVHPGLRFVEGTQLSDAGPAPSVRARVTWTSTDGSGVCAQRVRVRDLDGTAPVRTVRPGAQARHVALDVVVGQRYRVEVLAVDCVGNETVRIRTVSARLLQEDELYLDPESGPWDVERRSQASGGAWVFDEGQVVVFEAARSVALVGATGPGRGSADVTSISTSAEVDATGPSRARVVVFQDRWDDLTQSDSPILEVLTRAPFVVDAVLLG